MPDNRITFRASEDLREWLGQRAERSYTGSPHVQAQNELDTWRTVLRVELRRIPLTLGEACAIADVFKGHAPTAGVVPTNIGTIYAGCYEEFTMAREGGPVPEVSSYGRKWEIDEEALLSKLQKLGPAADLALEDAIGRWWQDPDSDQSQAAFEKVGIRIIPAPAPRGDGQE